MPETVAPTADPIHPQAYAIELELRIAQVGEALAASLQAVIDALPGRPQKAGEIGRTVGVDKVLSSRLCKALRNRDPLAVIHLMPGPEPLRRILRGAGKKGVPARIIEPAEAAVQAFEQLIREEAGDRSALGAIISAWLPEAREEFELRRKQAAYRALSQLKGVTADISLGAVFLHPNEDGRSIDIVWVFGSLGLQRLRPGAPVKFATRRIADMQGPRRPMTLERERGDSLESVRLDAFCSSPVPQLDVVRAGDVVHYNLASNGFGPKSAVDLVFAEVNLAEIPRYVAPEKNRKGYVFAEISTPVRALHFDVFVHEEVYPNSDPTLFIYDTALDGVADINNPARDIDRIEMSESIQSLGRGLSSIRTADIPMYGSLVQHICNGLQWDGDRFRGYRCRIEYPIYGSQVAMAFDPPAPPPS